MNIKNIIRNKKESSSKYVYRILKENIMNLNLKPRDFISEPSVSEFFHLSRTPIREAFIQLNKEGLITSNPQKKSMVTKLNINLIKESVFMRKTLEKEILKKVISVEDLSPLIKKLQENIHFQKKLVSSKENLYDFFYLDNEFHKLIFNSVSMGRVWNAIVTFNIDHSRLRILEILEKQSYETIIEHHQHLIDSIKKRDIEALEEFPKNHLYKYLDTYKELQLKYPDYFLTD